MRGARSSGTVNRAPVCSHGSDAVELLLRGTRRERPEPGDHALDRRTVHTNALLRRGEDDRASSASGPCCESEKSKAADGADGSAGNLSETPSKPPRKRVSAVSVPAAGFADRPSGPGMGGGYYLYPATARLRVPNGGDGLVQQVRDIMGSILEPGGGLLREGSSPGIGGEEAGDIQQRSGEPVHERGFYGRAPVSGRANKHGRTGGGCSTTSWWSVFGGA